VLGTRANQISHNSALYTCIDASELGRMSVLEIAERELAQQKIPFKIRRFLPNKRFEEWHLS
jgi:DNA-directed RNA polymerase I, II, and III subunit RPABC2